MKPLFEDTHCPRCGNSDGTENDEAVQMVLTTNTWGDRTRVIWCAAGHITVTVSDEVVLLGSVQA